MPNTRSMSSHPTDPDFPHGSVTGYAYGCRVPADCPAEPTCSSVKSEHGAAHRARQSAAPPTEGRVTAYVSKRLAKTLGCVTVEQLAFLTGVPSARIQQIADRAPEAGVRVPEVVAAKLDAAWALLVHGKDLSSITEHGTEPTYREELCRCPPCTAASTRVRKRVAAGVKVALTNVPTTDALRAHTAALAAAAGGITELGRQIGVHWHTIQAITNGERKCTTAKVRRDLLRLTTADVAAASQADPLVLADVTRTWVRSLHALGYPLRWVLEQVNADPDAHLSVQITSQKYVRASGARAVRALVERIGDQRARTEDGIGAPQIARAITIAQREGWYPPAFYDDDGTLDVRAIPDHPWSKLDERAAKRVEGARMLAQGVTHGETAKYIGVSNQTIGRIAKSLGFVYDYRNALDHVASRDVIRRVCELHADYTAGERGPVTTALILGMLDPEFLTKDHPEVVAWFADIADVAA